MSYVLLAFAGYALLTFIVNQARHTALKMDYSAHALWFIAAVLALGFASLGGGNG